MRINRLPLAAALVLAAVIPAAGGPAVFYDFERIEDDMLIDLSGNGCHGRLFGEYERVPGGIRFMDGRLEIPPAQELNTGEGSLVLEIVLEIEKDMPFTFNGTVIPFTADYEDSPRAWELLILENGLLRFNVRNPAGLFRASESSGPLPVGRPVHIACFVEADDFWHTTNRVIYINGRRQPDVRRASAAKLEGLEKITVGAQGPGRRQFRGIIRELRLYGRPPAGEDDPVIARGREYARGE